MVYFVSVFGKKLLFHQGKTTLFKIYFGPIPVVTKILNASRGSRNPSWKTRNAATIKEITLYANAKQVAVKRTWNYAYTMDLIKIKKQKKYCICIWPKSGKWMGQVITSSFGVGVPNECHLKLLKVVRTYYIFQKFRRK